jgi:hypothetical protein
VCSHRERDCLCLCLRTHTQQGIISPRRQTQLGWRADGETQSVWQVSLFRRKLNEGDITAGGGGRSGSNKVESRH